METVLFVLGFQSDVQMWDSADLTHYKPRNFIMVVFHLDDAIFHVLFYPSKGFVNSFNVYVLSVLARQWEEAEMLYLLQQMYVDLGFVDKYHIEVEQNIPIDTSTTTIRHSKNYGRIGYIYPNDPRRQCANECFE